jgi:type III secretion system FlhB-like substrate exporter
MGTWFKTSEEILERAKNKKLNAQEKNHLSTLYRHWNVGMYDEDPQMLYNELIQMIK